MTQTARPIHKLVDVVINGATYQLGKGEEYTGAQIKDIGHVPPGETLFLKEGQGNERRIGDDETVKIHSNMDFESGPDGGVS
jgi:hypothetical protein